MSCCHLHCHCADLQNGSKDTYPFLTCILKSDAVCSGNTDPLTIYVLFCFVLLVEFVEVAKLFTNWWGLDFPNVVCPINHTELLSHFLLCLKRCTLNCQYPQCSLDWLETEPLELPSKICFLYIYFTHLLWFLSLQFKKAISTHLWFVLYSFLCPWVIF